MTRIKHYLLHTLWEEEEGQDLTEYALLMVLVALAAIAAVDALGHELREQFFHIAERL